MTAVEADDDRAGVDRLDPAGQVGHEESPGHHVVGVGVVRQQVAFVAVADAVDHPVAGEVDDRDLSPSSLLGQPFGEVVGDRVAGGRLIGEELDLVGRKTADLGVAQDARHRLRVAHSVTERPDLLFMQVLADPDQDRCPVTFARSSLHRSAFDQDSR